MAAKSGPMYGHVAGEIEPHSINHFLKIIIVMKVQLAVKILEFFSKLT